MHSRKASIHDRRKKGEERALATYTIANTKQEHIKGFQRDSRNDFTGEQRGLREDLESLTRSLQVSEFLELPCTLEHHGALESYQHAQREQRIVPAGFHSAHYATKKV